MDEKQAIRAAALRRARRECPEARQAVQDLYDNERWYRYWQANTYDNTTIRRQAIAVATIDRGE